MRLARKSLFLLSAGAYSLVLVLSYPSRYSLLEFTGNGCTAQCLLQSQILHLLLCASTFAQVLAQVPILRASKGGLSLCSLALCALWLFVVVAQPPFRFPSFFSLPLLLVLLFGTAAAHWRRRLLYLCLPFNPIHLIPSHVIVFLVVTAPALLPALEPFGDSSLSSIIWRILWHSVSDIYIWSATKQVPFPTTHDSKVRPWSPLPVLNHPTTTKRGNATTSPLYTSTTHKTKPFVFTT